MEMMEVVAKIVDESDPDTSLPNNIHMYQVRRKLSIGGRNSKVKWFRKKRKLDEATRHWFPS